MSYFFQFKYDGDDDSLIVLPLSPKSFDTVVGNANSTVELVSVGQFNIIKDIGLRTFEFTVLLPKNDILIEASEYGFNEPIYYLSAFREFKASKKPVRMLITRTLPNGTSIFPGNILVSFEDYYVYENAGEEGDFWVKLKLKEYRNVVASVFENGGGGVIYEKIQNPVDEKKTPSEYIVKKGDSLWAIAKLYLDNGARYKEIAELNNIQDPDRISIGMKLILPEK